MKLKTVVIAVLFFAVYFISGKAGLSLAFFHKSASPVWPPTGIAIALLLLGGIRFWPVVFLGAFFVNITTAGSILTSLGIAVGNTLEGLLGAVLVNKFAQGQLAFDRAQNVFKFTLLAGMIAPVVSATFGVTSLVLGGYADGSNYGSVWLTWWLGDFVGAVVIAPVIVLWASQARKRLSRSQIFEAAALFSSVIGVAWLVFRRHYPIEFFCMPPLLWSAFRFGPREASSSTLVLSIIAIWGTLHGQGPFVTGTPNDSLLLLQAFMGVMCVSMLALAAVVKERKEVEEGLRILTQQLHNRVESGAEVLLQKEKELVRTTAEREQLDMFASLASHDLQEPLRKISVFADLLKGECAAVLTENGANYMERLQMAVARMSRLIKDLHHFSKTGAEQETARVLDLNNVLKEVVSDLELRIKDAAAHVVLRPVPSVKAGPIEMRELFQNIISNAIKFRKKNQPPTIRIEGRILEEGTVEITTEDNGIGFDNEYAEKIFKPFERLHPSADYEGTGIGLAICHRIVERLGGKIIAKGFPGKGATFIIQLPQPASEDVIVRREVGRI